jgi:hypothetical protein
MLKSAPDVVALPAAVARVCAPVVWVVAETVIRGSPQAKTLI